MSKLIMALLPLLILTITQLTLARTTPNPTQTTPPLSTPSQDFLSAHNQARASLNVPPLKWSQILANATAQLVAYQKAKNNCQFADLSKATKYGANQQWAMGAVVSPKMVVDTWVSEKKFYDYGSGSCVANHHCGVYTQVVWRKSVELGCAQASCVKDGSTLTVCFYNPPGNIVGEKPY